MGTRKRIYHFFFPVGKDLPMKKLRWTIMVILQELRLCKFRAVLKYFFKPSYHRDINVLRDLLSKAPLKGTKGFLELSVINFSHEINYPDWVTKLKYDYVIDGIPFKRIKVFKHEGKWVVIDGNHRLKAMKDLLDDEAWIDVLVLEYR